MKIYTSIICAAMALGAFVSCKKTEDLPAVAQSNILSFSVGNLPDTVLYGAVDNTDKTITVYLPFYYSIVVVDPVIKLTEGARIVEEILPFKVTDTVKYTVKGKDSTTTVYKAFVKIQAPGVPFTLIERSGADNIEVTNPGYSQFWFGGSFFTTNVALTKSWLVSSTGVETEIKGLGIYTDTDAGTGKTSYYINTVTIPPTMDSGLYRVKSSVFGRTATMQHPIRISYLRPEFGRFTTRTVKQGDTFTLTALVQQGMVFTDIKSFSISTNGTTWQQLTVDSYTRTEAIIRVPDNVPPGAYSWYKMEFNSWPALTNSGSITTIVAK